MLLVVSMQVEKALALLDHRVTYKSSLALATTFSTVNPNFSKTTFPGADAP
jgi:hypothetical protein